MRDQFAHFYVPDGAAVEAAMTTGLVVPDTNVLLRLYEFNGKARDELFEALENLGDRLWIPYQVGHEVHRKRLEIIAKQEKFFKEARGGLDGAIAGLQRQVGAFRLRLALSKDELKEIEDGIGALQKLIQSEVAKASKANEVRMKDRDSDKVLARLERLFDKRVGGPMRPGELRKARKEAERRGREKIPPGYEDADKDKGDPAGDYLIWRQLMTEAKTRALPVVFITDDTKPDWYRREPNGMPLGARYELREELMREAGVPLLLLTTRTFIDHAEKYLNAEFSEETREQAKELPVVSEINTQRQRYASNRLAGHSPADRTLLTLIAEDAEAGRKAWVNAFEAAIESRSDDKYKSALAVLEGYLSSDSKMAMQWWEDWMLAHQRPESKSAKQET